MGGSSSQTIGYEYSMSLHMGIGRGPVDALLAIEVGGRIAWSGEITENQEFNILASDLFGGQKGEGGIRGKAITMFGGPDQVVPDQVKVALGNVDLQPEFRGVFTMFFDGMICAINPYPKPWKFKTRRLRSGWDGGVWYPDKIEIIYQVPNPDVPLFPLQVHAMNPAHIIYECLTNRVWGRGLPRSRIDDAAFRAAADRLYDEEFGICIRWARTDILTTFLQTVLDHIAGVLRQDKATGLYTLKLLRKDYNAAALPVYTTDNGILEIREASNGSMSDAVNEVIVTWHNPVDNKPGEVRVQNVAAIQTAGSTNSAKVSYTGCPTQELAAKLAQRDLKLRSTNLRRLTVVVDRALWRLQPGDVFKITDTARGINDLVVRVSTAEEAGNTDGRITITCVQDVFALGLSTMVPPPVLPPPEPERVPPPAGPTLMYEKPYIELNREYPPGEFNALLPETGVFNYHMQRVDGTAQSFDVYVDADGSGFVDLGVGEFTATCELDGPVNPVLEIWPIRNIVDIEYAVVGGVAAVGPELVRVVAIDAEAGTMEVRRGVGDTRPFIHNEGDKVWFVTQNGGTDYRAYAATETIKVRGTPFNGSGALPVEDAPEEQVTMDWRFFRPYLPGKVTAETPDSPQSPWFNVFRMYHPDGNITVRWAHRDRLLQADQLIDQHADSIGPEPGVTYAIRVFNNDDIQVNEFLGLTGTEFTYNYAQAAIDLEVESIAGPFRQGYLNLFAVRDDYSSWQSYVIPIEVYREQQTEFSVNNLQTVDYVRSPGVNQRAITSESVPWEFDTGLFDNVNVSVVDPGPSYAAGRGALATWSVGYSYIAITNNYKVWAHKSWVSHILTTEQVLPTALLENGPYWPGVGAAIPNTETNVPMFNAHVTAAPEYTHTSGNYVFIPYLTDAAGDSTQGFEIQPVGYYTGTARTNELPAIDVEVYDLLGDLTVQGLAFDIVSDPQATTYAVYGSQPSEATLLADAQAFVASQPAPFANLATYQLSLYGHVDEVSADRWLRAEAYTITSLDTEDVNYSVPGNFSYYNKSSAPVVSGTTEIPGSFNNTAVEYANTPVTDFVPAINALNSLTGFVNRLHVFKVGVETRMRSPLSELSTTTLVPEHFPYKAVLALTDPLTGDSSFTIYRSDGGVYASGGVAAGKPAPFDYMPANTEGVPSVVYGVVPDEDPNKVVAVVDSDAGPYRPAFLIGPSTASYEVEITRDLASNLEGFNIPFVYVLVE